jgi:hypothetical protein
MITGGVGNRYLPVFGFCSPVMTGMPPVAVFVVEHAEIASAITHTPASN